MCMCVIIIQSKIYSIKSNPADTLILQNTSVIFPFIVKNTNLYKENRNLAKCKQYHGRKFQESAPYQSLQFQEMHPHIQK